MRIIDHLETSGLLRQGAVNRAKLRALPAEPYYSWRVTGKPDAQYYGELGFDAEGYKQLEALFKIMEGEAAKAMQKLLARFAEDRNSWKPLSYEHISWGEPAGGLCLGLGPDQNQLGEKGTTLKVLVWYKNVGKEPVTVPVHKAPGVNQYRLMFTAEKGGKPLYIGFVFQRNETIGPAKRELQPGDRFFEEFALAAPLTFGEVLTSPAPALPALGPGESLTLRAGICAKGDPRDERDWRAADTLRSGPITVMREGGQAPR